MPGELGSIRDGLGACLEAVEGLRVVDHPPGDWREFPLAVIGSAVRNAGSVCLAGHSFEGEVIVAVFVDGVNPEEAYADLEQFMEPLGERSVEAAIDRDPTLGGSADYAALVRIDSVGSRTLGNSRCFAADFAIRFMVQL